MRYYMSSDKFFRYVFQYDYVERERCGEHLLAVFEATLVGNLFLQFFFFLLICLYRQRDGGMEGIENNLEIVADLIERFVEWLKLFVTDNFSTW